MVNAKLEGPRGVYFGAGCRRDLAELVGEYGRRLLLVTGAHFLRESGYEEELMAQFRGLDCATIRCPRGEPTVEGVQELRDGIGAFRPDVIVAAGGGSVLDTAKALSGTLDRSEPVIDFLEGIGRGVAVDRRTVPWLALPTTSGTGSEVTKNAVIKSAQHGVKKSMRSVFLYADFAFVDPELTSGLSLKLTGLTGLDALTQLVEAYVTVKRNPLVRALVRDRVVPTLEALEKLAGNLSDTEARVQLAYGSMVSGIALANAGLGAVHGFASGLGGSSELPHGLICATFLAPVLRFNAARIEADIREITSNSNDAVGRLSTRVEELVSRFGLEAELKSYPVPEDDIPLIATRSAGSSMSGNPIELTQQDKEGLLRQVLVPV